jgi:KDO2-lipid IV(A) lauroyltransferase
MLVIPRSKPVALRNLQHCFPEKTETERLSIYQASLDTLARNLYGFALGPTLTKSRAAKLCDYTSAAAVLEEARKGSPETGVLMLTMHFGIFELHTHLHAILYKPCSVLGRAFDLPTLDRWWNGQRESNGNTLFHRKGGYREIVKRLNNREDVAILFDQNVKANHAVFPTFFGIPASTSKSFALAAIRSGAPTVFGSCHQTEDGEIIINYEKIEHPSNFGETKEEQINGYTQELCNAAERHIRKTPEAWFWIHRRWKTRPNGEAENFYR